MEPGDDATNVWCYIDRMIRWRWRKTQSHHSNHGQVKNTIQEYDDIFNVSLESTTTSSPISSIPDGHDSRLSSYDSHDSLDSLPRQNVKNGPNTLQCFPNLAYGRGRQYHLSPVIQEGRPISLSSTAAGSEVTYDYPRFPDSPFQDQLAEGD